MIYPKDSTTKTYQKICLKRKLLSHLVLKTYKTNIMHPKYIMSKANENIN